jgi:hypothetical protein
MSRATLIHAYDFRQLYPIFVRFRWGQVTFTRAKRLSDFSLAELGVRSWVVDDQYVRHLIHLDSEVEVHWREYNKRADIEKRIGELKYDLVADDFCLHEFFATEAAFCSILLLFNLLSEFQRVIGFATYQPATLRVQVFRCGAIPGKAGHQTMLHLSSAWGGIQSRISLFANILANVFPKSPKLEFDTGS